MTEEIIAAIIVIGAVFLLVRKLFKGNNCASCCGADKNKCAGCPAGKTENNKTRSKT